jgi:methyl-accepting chemotaxis protein
VVTDEVRKLAERTATSTTDIANMILRIEGATDAVVDAIHRIQQEASTGNEYNRSAEERLRLIVTSTEDVAKMARQIAGAVQEQSVASEEVARNMEKISVLTEDNSQSIHNVDDAAKRLAKTAGELQRLVGVFKVAT